MGETIAPDAVRLILFWPLATQIAVFPLFGLQATVGESLLIGGIFTVISLARSFALRRLFNRLLA